ncbi:hypothetical protein MAPG_05317 [Magnaporthiopsis poae ATCC 64411]|uniref:Cutinase n=1 Tax=Magnaporthiopsis poae (strain ATCC 64411 / 73-15) TaxID=644358 RepID=A0A0C4DZ29_MAGP6|nr:hypothetical protein MAPG_05317 [Magnaporthiopsis poae ATCC 64411]
MLFPTPLVAATVLATLSLAHPLGVEHVQAAQLDPRQRGGGSTENAEGCADMIIVFARGTTEAGNVGSIVGPPLLAATKSAAGGKTVAMQGVEYAANIPGFLAGGDRRGSAEMAKQVQNFANSCPDSKITMSGYSQGGQVVHNAAQQLDAATQQRISSAVIFGDPKNGEPVAGVPADKTLIICRDGDNICNGGFRVLAPHLQYGRDADQAAQFIVNQASK